MTKAITFNQFVARNFNKRIGRVVDQLSRELCQYYQTRYPALSEQWVRFTVHSICFLLRDIIYMMPAARFTERKRTLEHHLFFIQVLGRLPEILSIHTFESPLVEKCAYTLGLLHDATQGRLNRYNPADYDDKPDLEAYSDCLQSMSRHCIKTLTERALQYTLKNFSGAPTLWSELNSPASESTPIIPASSVQQAAGPTTFFPSAKRVKPDSGFDTIAAEDGNTSHEPSPP